MTDHKKKNIKKSCESSGGVGIGAAIGVAMGAAFDQVAIGIAIGVALGAAFDQRYCSSKKSLTAKEKNILSIILIWVILAVLFGLIIL